MKQTLKKILAFIKRPLNVVLNLLHLNTPARIMVALSPVFVSAAGLLMTLAGRLGVHHLSSGELVGLFETGALLAASKVLMWLHGAQKSEAAQSHAKLLSPPLQAIRDPRRELLGSDDVPASSAPAAEPPREVGLPG
jgi:hypothetical protein